MRQSRALKPRPCSYPRCCELRPAEHDEILPVRHLHSLIRTGRGRRAGRPDHDLAAVAPVGMAAVTLAPPGRQRKVMTPLAPVPESGRKTETLWFRGGPGAGRRLSRARSPDPARLSRGRQPVSRSPVPVRPPTTAGPGSRSHDRGAASRSAASVGEITGRTRPPACQRSSASRSPHSGVLRRPRATSIC